MYTVTRAQSFGKCSWYKSQEAGINMRGAKTGVRGNEWCVLSETSNVDQ